MRRITLVRIRLNRETILKFTATTAHPNGMLYRADIDGLRAVAVLAVILHHAWPNWFVSGFIGVDIFFVISGYLITLIILKQLEAGKFSIVDFYVRRAYGASFPHLSSSCLQRCCLAGWSCCTANFAR